MLVGDTNVFHKVEGVVSLDFTQEAQVIESVTERTAIVCLKGLVVTSSLLHLVDYIQLTL